MSLITSIGKYFVKNAIGMGEAGILNVLTRNLKNKDLISILTPSPGSGEKRGRAASIFVAERFFLAALILLIAGSGFFFEFSYADRFYPGVSIAGMPVGGKTFADVLGHFKNEEKIMQESGLRITLSNVNQATTTQIKIPMSARGFTPDKFLQYYAVGNWEDAVNQAYAFGRSGSFRQRFQEQKAGLISGKDFNLSAIAYKESIESLISRELEGFLKKPVPAQFALNNRGEVYILPEKNGETINPEEIIAEIQDHIHSFDFSPISFQAKEDVPHSTEEKLRPFLGLAQELASQTSLRFHSRGYWWRVGGPRLSTWLQIRNGGEIGINTDKLEIFISKTIGADIDDPAQNSRFKIKNGKLTEIIPGRSGSVVNGAKIIERVDQIISSIQKSFAGTENLASTLKAIGPEINFNSKTGSIDIPVEMIAQDPKITKETINQYSIKELVGFSRTSFKGSSEDRKTNIRVGVSSLDGLLIAPGEEFSAVNAIGYVTEEAGYVKEYVIKDNRSIKELGGGLCQIGTTLFRLALNAGLPVTERVSHRYVVGYYGPGLDATIYGPHPDLRFVNDTGQYLLLQGRVEGTDVVLELYGQNDGRIATITDPVLTDHIPAPETKYVPDPDLPLNVKKCSETPRVGVTADVTYRVNFLDGKVHEQAFHSIYQPWGEICLVGTKI